jgi:uroporphyrinogen-III decarboxylase
MKPYDRIMATLSGKKPDRVPVVLWGRDGPFILGSGCIIPGVAKPENIAAMVAAAEKYGLY